MAMLSSVLKSDRAALVNIAIMRIFTKLRSFLMLEKDLSDRMNRLEHGANKMFKVVFERLDNLEVQLPNHPENRIRSPRSNDSMSGVAPLY